MAFINGARSWICKLFHVSEDMTEFNDEQINDSNKKEEYQVPEYTDDEVGEDIYNIAHMDLFKSIKTIDAIMLSDVIRYSSDEHLNYIQFRLLHSWIELVKNPDLQEYLYSDFANDARSTPKINILKIRAEWEPDITWRTMYVRYVHYGLNRRNQAVKIVLQGAVEFQTDTKDARYDHGMLNSILFMLQHVTDKSNIRTILPYRLLLLFHPEYMKPVTDPIKTQYGYITTMCTDKFYALHGIDGDIFGDEIVNDFVIDDDPYEFEFRNKNTGKLPIRYHGEDVYGSKKVINITEYYRRRNQRKNV